MNFVFDLDGTICFKGQPLDEDEHHSIYRNIDPLNTASNKQLHQLNGISKMVMFSPTDEVKDLLQLMNMSLIEHHTEALIDISPSGIDKAKGLNQLGITEYIAFGNDTNDRVLFEQAIYSVCVGDHPVSRYANEMVAPAQAASRIQELAYQYGER
jgi:hydroxymethylpyrimidine pyrophosphatase-like HAD family hydrolase